MAEKYTVMEAGHGGKAMAAHLALRSADIAVGEAKWSVSELTRYVQEGLVN